VLGRAAAQVALAGVLDAILAAWSLALRSVLVPRWATAAPGRRRPSSSCWSSRASPRPSRRCGRALRIQPADAMRVELWTA
jgi:hypothetical protein